MCEKHLSQCFVLTVLHRLPSHSSVFQALIFFTMTVFKREIVSQSVFYMVMLQDTCDLTCATDDNFVSVQTV